jgi:hypothetical protein
MYNVHLNYTNIEYCEGKSIIISSAVVFVSMLAALLFRAASLCVVSVLLFLCRFDVARSVPSSLPCH